MSIGGERVHLYSIIYLGLMVFLLYLLFTVGFPFLMAIIIALLIDPFVKVLSKVFFGKRAIASFIACTSFFVIVIGSSYLLGLKGVRELIILSKSIVDYIKNNYDQLTDFTWSAQTVIGPYAQDMNLQINDFIKTGLNSLQSIVLGISNVLIGFLQGVPGLLLDTLIFVVALYMVSMTLPKIKVRILSIFATESQHKIEQVMQKLYNAIFGFIRGQLILSSIVFTLTLIGLLIINISYPFATAGIVTIVDVLPIFGTGSVIVPLTIYYIIKGNYFLAVGLLILYGVLFAFRRVAEPKILGDAMGIGALSTLASMYIAFKLVGAIGLFLGPAVVILVSALISADILKLNVKV